MRTGPKAPQHAGSGRTGHTANRTGTATRPRTRRDTAPRSLLYGSDGAPAPCGVFSRACNQPNSMAASNAAARPIRFIRCAFFIFRRSFRFASCTHPPYPLQGTGMRPANITCRQPVCNNIIHSCRMCAFRHFTKGAYSGTTVTSIPASRSRRVPSHRTKQSGSA